MEAFHLFFIASSNAYGCIDLQKLDPHCYIFLDQDLPSNAYISLNRAFATRVMSLSLLPSSYMTVRQPVIWDLENAVVPN